MRDEVVYEWLFEEIKTYEDGEFDILDHSHSDLLSGLESELSSGINGRLCLVRETGNEDDCMTGRQWAYVEEGQLPAEFDEGAKVPKRFIRELEAFVKSTGIEL